VLQKDSRWPSDDARHSNLLSILILVFVPIFWGQIFIVPSIFWQIFLPCLPCQFPEKIIGIGELLNVKEGHINLTENWIIFPQPKEKEPKFIHLLPEYSVLIKEIRNMSPAMPNVFFFRHLKSGPSVTAGSKFGLHLFNKWWKRACENLNISGVTLYAGTKHSTVTALGKLMSPEQIKHNVTGHTSSAFQRYFLPDHNEKISATRKVAEMQGESTHQITSQTKKRG